MFTCGNAVLLGLGTVLIYGSENSVLALMPKSIIDGVSSIVGFERDRRLIAERAVKRLEGIRDEAKDLVAERLDLRNKLLDFDRMYSAVLREKNDLEEHLESLRNVPQNPEIVALSSRVQELERERIELIGRADEWKELFDTAVDDESRYKRIIRELMVSLRIDDETVEDSSVSSVRRSKYFDRFTASGFDYDVVDALVMGGFKRARFRDKSYLPRVYLRRNSSPRISTVQQILDLDSVVDSLIKCRAVLVYKQGETVSLNVRTNDIAVPVIGEYLAEIFEECDNLRSGVSDKNGSAGETDQRSRRES